ncbi:NTP transferase domain-containing protein [Fulvivirga lutimaris]|uniref:NTP transferase domain-containing protein n=1 Tax=Fulvivirga lutimaris TaxID=1819566 RepID=UPI0016290754
MTTRKNSDLIGIVLMGGNSQRMGKDKSQISYHRIPQYQYLFQLLSKYCSEVYLSCNAKQQTKIESSFPLIKDVNDNKGPLEGIKSAFNIIDKSLLTVPCDMPVINDELILQLINSRNSDLDAVCYSDTDGHINPLFAIWEESCIEELKKFKGDSPKQFLKLVRTQVLKASSEALKNINTPDELNLYLKNQG